MLRALCSICGVGGEGLAALLPQPRGEIGSVQLRNQFQPKHSLRDHQKSAEPRPRVRSSDHTQPRSLYPPRPKLNFQLSSSPRCKKKGLGYDQLLLPVHTRT